MSGTTGIYSILMFLTVAFSGIVAYRIVSAKNAVFGFVLRFGGAYLFGITIIHLLPEVFNGSPADRAGIFILIGFFLQLILDYFSSGIEHGHIHRSNHPPSAGRVPYALILSLFFHAFLEGTVLSQPHGSAHSHSDMLLSGIILHKIPVAFALVAIMKAQSAGKRTTLFFLFLLAAGSPLGLITGEVLPPLELFGQQLSGILTAVVAGSFLHVSTTIFFESGPDHRFNAGKLIVSLAGAGLAVSFYYFF